MGNIGIHIPFPVLIINKHTADLQFQSLVSYRPDVLQNGGETRHLLYRHIEQQIARLLVIGIKRHRQTILEEARTQTYIVRSRSLPLQIWVRLIRDDIAGSQLVIDNYRSGYNVGDKLIITNFLITYCSDGGTQLYKVNLLSKMDPLLTVDIPGST